MKGFSWFQRGLGQGFLLGVDFGASWAMFRPILGHFGAPRQPAGLQFKSRRKESLRLGSNQRPKGSFGPPSRALLEYRFYIGVMLGHFGGQNGEISATKARTHDVHIDVCHNSFAGDKLLVSNPELDIYN